MKICVVGGGIFGCTAAIHAAKVGHDVTLYEEKPTLMSCASTGNQCRLHEGYHYPRWSDAVGYCRDGNASFRKEYGKAVIDGGRQLYAIAANHSKTTPDQYLKFCEDNDLPVRVVSSGDIFNPSAVDLAVEVDEGRININTLKLIILDQIEASGVQLSGYGFSPKMGWDYDKVIIAAYASTNAVLAGLPGYDQCRLDSFQFEVVEKPVVRMPASFAGVGAVVMDGEFGCVDPMGGSDYHVLGHVSAAIWHRNIGLTAEVPYPLASYLDAGVVKDPSRTKITDFIEAGAEFIPALADAEY